MGKQMTGKQIGWGPHVVERGDVGVVDDAVETGVVVVQCEQQ